MVASEDCCNMSQQSKFAVRYSKLRRHEEGTASSLLTVTSRCWAGADGAGTRRGTGCHEADEGQKSAMKEDEPDVTHSGMADR